MDKKQRMNYMYEGGNFYLWVMGDAAHMEHIDNGVYEIMKPLKGYVGPASIFNIRTDHLSDADLEKVVKSIQDMNMHTWWPFNPSESLMKVLYKDKPRPVDDGFELYACMLSDEMPVYPPCPIEITVRRVTNLNEFEIWCRIDIENEHNGFKVFDAKNHFHLIENGKMRCYLGYYNGIPVTTAAILYNNGIASLEFVSTVPEYRQKGIAKAVCKMAIQEAFHDGARLITIRSINNGHKLGTALGFSYLNEIGE